MFGRRYHGSARGVTALALVCIVGLAACGGSASTATPVSSLPSAQPSASTPSAAAPSASSAGGSAACQPSSGKVTLTFWSWMPGIDKIVAEWNKANPDIQVDVKVVVQGNAGDYDNIANALKAGNAPDMAMIEQDVLPSFRLQDGLADISGCDFVAAAQSAFVPYAWSMVTMGGDGVYGLPTDLGPLVMYYRKDLFAKWGISVPTTWDEYYQAAQMIKAKDSTVSITDVALGAAWMTGLAWQNGAKPIQISGNTVKLDYTGAATSQVAAYWQKLIDEKLVRTDLAGFSPAEFAALNNGTLATQISAVWDAGIIAGNAKSTAGDWAVAPLPQWQAGASASGNYGGSTTAVLKSSQHPYEAAKFALWLSTDPAAQSMVVSLAGGYPPTTAGQDLAQLKTGDPFYGGQVIYDVVKAASQGVNPDWQWSPNQRTINKILGDEITKVLGGQETFQAALQATQDKALADLKSLGIATAP